MAAGCVLLASNTQLSVDGGAILEKTDLRVESAAECHSLRISLPPGVVILHKSGVQKNSDGTRLKIEEIQWTQSIRGLDDRATLTLHLPAMQTGDQAHVRLHRQWPEGSSWHWTPGQPSAGFAKLTLRGALRTATSQRRFTVEHPEAEFSVAVRSETHPILDGFPSDFSEFAPPSEPVQLEQTLKIQVPPGDPLIALWPGAGSQVEVTEQLDFLPEPNERVYIIPLRPGAHKLEWSAEPKGSAILTQRTDDAVVVLPSSEGPARLLVRYLAPDAPTYGSVPVRENTVVHQVIRAPNGRVQWEPNKKYWRLASIEDHPVLPNRAVLVRSLTARFEAASIPEPGLPMSLRGRQTNWELAAELRPTLMGRVRPATWTADPLWPRPLMKARKSEAVSPTEATLILQRYAEQAGFYADWNFVRLDSEGSELATSPAGFEASILRVVWGDEARWVDPLCELCGDFELRPELYGRALLGPAETASPPLPKGAWTIVVDGSTLLWELTGPAALNLRRWVQAHGLGDLVGLVAGDGGQIVETSGLAEPEQTIRLQATAAARLGAEHFSNWIIGAPMAELSHGLWLGERRLRVEARSCESVEYSGTGWSAVIEQEAATWTIHSPLDPDDQRDLAAHLSTHYPRTGDCQ
jgi:hypothetical protein